MEKQLDNLSISLKGELYFDSLMRALYATDASAYRELPLAVAYPKDVVDIKKLIRFSIENRVSLIPRAAGTSLAGQCVGAGIVVDVSKHMNKILEVNPDEKWVQVQPGVIRDELNHFLKPYGLFFGPDTSTANRCMIGGMVGNNSCGKSSIKYGTTRDHVLELKTVLSDETEVLFKSLHEREWHTKLQGEKLENRIYRFFSEKLSDKNVQKRIIEEFPKKNIHRRNTGYAVDAILDMQPFSENGSLFNLSKLLCGSEGTLAFTTKIKLNLSPIPPKEKVVVCIHFNTVIEALIAVRTVMEFEPFACELMDKTILDCTKENIQQQKNRFFIQGDPGAILMVQLNADELSAVSNKADELINKLKTEKIGFSYPKIFDPAIKKIWDLRKAGLGVLANLPGDAKAVACVEDTAVDIADLPDYIEEFTAMMSRYGQQSVYYAHAGAGELHLRPILNLKKKKDVQLFREISEVTARLVKKYQGSLSGEHGDGRVRAEFIPLMVGEENYQLFCEIKQIWDPGNIFNPGKITSPVPMDSSLRYEGVEAVAQPITLFDFSSAGGMLRAAEKCNGSGDCRRLDFSGGTMCPSYRATRHEKDSTRARANALREFLTRKSNDKNPFAHRELKEVLDLCLSCKGCTSECPSNVDMSTMKAEFLYQFQKQHGVPIRSWLMGNIANISRFGMLSPKLFNYFLSHNFSGGILKKILGVSHKRALPKLGETTLVDWFKNNELKIKWAKSPIKSVYLFFDEFTNFNDVEIGIKTIRLLAGLGYKVNMIKHCPSGRAHISKGLLKSGQKLAKQNVSIFKNIISEECPLIGIEPSALLSFVDEYPKLVDQHDREAAENLAKNVYLIDDFLAKEIALGNITAEQFTVESKRILFHGHCHQKALSEQGNSALILSLPRNYSVELIPSGCCGMAGSFGYEEEHYEVSMKIGELVLFPSIKKEKEETLIAATGTSCRHQIFDGTGRKALHPIEILWQAFLNNE